jgi:hypothetical protein
MKKHLPEVEHGDLGSHTQVCACAFVCIKEPRFPSDSYRVHDLQKIEKLLRDKLCKR